MSSGRPTSAGRKKNLKSGTQHDLLVKVIIIGDSGVGKTNLLTRYCEGIFKDSYVATIGVDFKIKLIDLEGTKVKLQIWDTAGQERFRNITQTYFKGASGIILVYSINSYDSFRNINNWIKQIDNNSSEQTSKILIGAKSDMSADRQVPTEEAQQLADRHSMQFLELSAKTGDNVTECFYKLTQDIKEKKLSSGETITDTSGVNLNSNRNIDKQGRKNCEC